MNEQQLDKIVNALDEIAEAKAAIAAREGEIGVILGNIPSRYWKALKVPTSSILYATKIQAMRGRRD